MQNDKFTDSLSRRISLSGFPNNMVRRFVITSLFRVPANLTSIVIGLGSGLGGATGACVGGEAFYKALYGQDAVSPPREFIINTFVFKNDDTGRWTEPKLVIAYQNRLCGKPHPPTKEFYSLTHEQREQLAYTCRDPNIGIEDIGDLPSIDD